MGGSIAEGNITPAAEFNIWADPEAAARVFESGLDVTMIGLDVTHKALAHARARRAAPGTRPHGDHGGRPGRLLLPLPRRRPTTSTARRSTTPLQSRRSISRGSSQTLPRHVAVERAIGPVPGRTVVDRGVEPGRSRTRASAWTSTPRPSSSCCSSASGAFPEWDRACRRPAAGCAVASPTAPHLPTRPSRFFGRAEPEGGHGVPVQRARTVFVAAGVAGAPVPGRDRAARGARRGSGRVRGRVSSPSRWRGGRGSTSSARWAGPEATGSRGRPRPGRRCGTDLTDRRAGRRRLRGARARSGVARAVKPQRIQSAAPCSRSGTASGMRACARASSCPSSRRRRRSARSTSRRSRRSSSTLLPGDAYVKGFLRTYAERLGLDGQLYVDEFNSRFGDVEEPVIASQPRGRSRRPAPSRMPCCSLSSGSSP